MIAATDATIIEYIVFFAASLMMLGGALGVILFKNPVHAALGMVLTLFGVAVHFVAQEAHFLAAVQVIVYAGAIVVLFLFVIMLLGVDKSADLSVEPIKIQRPLAGVMAVGLFGLIVAAVAKAGGALTENNVAPPGRELLTDDAFNGDSNIQRLGQNLYNDHVFAFELTSVLLIVAVAGTVLLTRKWPRGMEMENSK
ncbi:NADH-quinone oxidoreductase subunit J family protein [Ilumatobacter coccineus]|jgi:NADH-quinone oxidoreductase subunit J|uniref:NADH-quinone oxidoreductase subunit J n=1 Tax=Ilumatobacter coccineus (strain NBRC 103263 / KCTC 29153 / YM16-304) TaxID=1313172 RepID=A0A6C7E625_ILUCY|nr:NADH-quinone oxidoreductase subunit J [Ilumatobacter coccineus]BAN00729.1 NADH-quinone oxidoreductase subunit J [Ilumatobacter coccineus YM16-304]